MPALGIARFHFLQISWTSCFLNLSLVVRFFKRSWVLLLHQTSEGSFVVCCETVAFPSLVDVWMLLSYPLSITHASSKVYDVPTVRVAELAVLCLLLYLSRLLCFGQRSWGLACSYWFYCSCGEGESFRISKKNIALFLLVNCYWVSYLNFLFVGPRWCLLSLMEVAWDTFGIC